MTGETQLRARLTRIKILRAIAERNGSAGFSEIRNATGLSTGSIYYHLERMGNYVTKDSKHYKITEEGLELLREIDNRATISPAHNTEEEASTTSGIQTEETIRQPQPLSEIMRDYSTPLLTMVYLAFASLFLYVNFYIILPMFANVFTASKMILNANMISSFVIPIFFVVSFLIMSKRHMLPAGFTRMMEPL